MSAAPPDPTALEFTHDRKPIKGSGRLAIAAAARPGSVILTSHYGFISRAIRAFTGSEVSHAMLALGNGNVIEAHTHKRSHGIYIRPLAKALTGDIRLAIVCHPNGDQPVNELALHTWAAAAQRSSGRFGNGTLGMIALAKLQDTFHEYLPKRLQCRANLARHAGDGAHSVICAELAYIGLLASGIHMDLRNAVLHRHIDQLHSPIVRHQLRAGCHEVEPTDSTEPDEPGTAKTNFIDAIKQIRTTLATPNQDLPLGDEADLVCPHDFLTTPTLKPVLALHRQGRRWYNVTLTATP